MSNQPTLVHKVRCAIYGIFSTQYKVFSHVYFVVHVVNIHELSFFLLT